MLERKINEIFGDEESTGFGTGWWSGVLSAFFGILAFGAVVCLHFPRFLSSPELRPYYPMDLMRLLIQIVIVGAILFGVVSAMLRRKKVLALTGMAFALGATLLGGASVPINEQLGTGPAIASARAAPRSFCCPRDSTSRALRPSTLRRTSKRWAPWPVLPRSRSPGRWEAKASARVCWALQPW